MVGTRLPLAVFISCTGATLIFTAARLLNLSHSPIGHTTHAECHGPCTTSTFQFYECYHTSAADPCSETLCIQNIAYYANCTDGGPAAEEPPCETSYSATAVWARQNKVSPAGPQTCSINPDGPYIAVPNQPQGNCKFVTNEGNWVGKCFISGCTGTILERGADRLGRDTCL
jgi:hypothetical protein